VPAVCRLVARVPISMRYFNRTPQLRSLRRLCLSICCRCDFTAQYRKLNSRFTWLVKEKKIFISSAADCMLINNSLRFHSGRRQTATSLFHYKGASKRSAHLSIYFRGNASLLFRRQRTDRCACCSTPQKKVCNRIAYRWVTVTS
jgi:hypothetical protein